MQRADHVARALFAGDGDGLHHFGEGLDDPEFIDALVHEEADGPIRGGDEQRDVDKGHVIADEQRAGLLREVVAANDLDAIDGVRDEEENQTPEPLRKQHQHIDGSGRGDEGGNEDDAARIEMDVLGENVVNAGRKRDADEGKKIGGGDDASLVLFFWAVLNERIDGDGEEAGPDARRRGARR